MWLKCEWSTDWERLSIVFCLVVADYYITDAVWSNDIKDITLREVSVTSFPSWHAWAQELERKSTSTYHWLSLLDQEEWKAQKCQTLGAAVHVIVLVCWLETEHWLSRDSQCLQCAFCFVPAHAKFAHEFLTLFTGLVQLIFSFFLNWFHTIWFYCSHTFHSFLSQITLCFSSGSKGIITARSHVFCLTGTAALHCGHTFVGGILTANSQ